MGRQANNKAAVFVSLFCGASLGFSLNITSGIINELPWSHESATVKGLVASCVLFGSLLGVFISGIIANIIGCKKTIFGGGVIIIVFSIALSIQKNVVLLIVFRAFLGLGVGTVNNMGPMYAGDEASAKFRGAVVAIYQIAVCGGSVLAYVLNLAFSFVTNGWRGEFATTCFFPVILTAVIFFLPETNSFVEKQEAKEKKTIVLMEEGKELSYVSNGNAETNNTDTPKNGETQLNNSSNPANSEHGENNQNSISAKTPSTPSTTEDGEEDCQGSGAVESGENHSTQTSNDSSSSTTTTAANSSSSSTSNNNINNADTTNTDNCLVTVIKNILSSKRALVVGVVLAIFIQITGVNIIFNFSPALVESAGITDSTAKLVGTIIIGVWNTLCTLPPVFIVDRVGRVVLLVVGYSIMFVGHLLVVLSSAIPGLAEKQYALALPGVAVFLFGFELGPGPVFNVVVSELYPLRARAHAMSLIITIFYVFQILVVLLYLPLVEAVGQRAVFIALSIFCVCVAVFAFFVVPETKGKELEN